MPYLVMGFYAVLCAIVVVMVAHSPARDRRDARRAAIALAANCLLSNIGWVSHAIGTWTRIDAATMILFLGMLWADRRTWKVRLCVLAVATMGVHATFAQAATHGYARGYLYPAVLNTIFALELWVVGATGSKGFTGSWKRLVGFS